MARRRAYQRAIALQTRVVASHPGRHDRAMPNENHVIRGIRSLATRQWGCITVADMLEAGLTRRQVECMVERGQLIRMHRGVYVLGALSPAPEQRWAAAVLAAGRGAV